MAKRTLRVAQMVASRDMSIGDRLSQMDSHEDSGNFLEGLAVSNWYNQHNPNESRLDF